MNFSLAAKSFIVDNGKLLIIKREPKDAQCPEAWEIPGGRLDPGEDPVEGLKRETKEEVGVDIEVLNPLSVRHFTRADGQIITMVVFLCKPLNKDIKISDEHTHFEWIDLKKGIGKLTDFYTEEVERYKKHFMI